MIIIEGIKEITLVTKGSIVICQSKLLENF